jgi:hypothetical protein
MQIQHRNRSSLAAALACREGTVRATGRRLALLISGNPRTMTQPWVVAEYAAAVRMLRSEFDVRVYAYLDVDGRDFHTSSTARADGAAVERALRQWGAPYVLEQHSDTNMLHASPAAANCSAVDCSSISGEDAAECAAARRAMTDQWLKIGAVTEMAWREERRTGERHDVFLRTRPDLCISRASRFLAVVTAHVRRCSPLLLRLHDAVAVYPRWAAAAYGSLWRSRLGCPLVPELLKRRSVAPPPAHDTSSAWIATHLAHLGVPSVELIGFFCKDDGGARGNAGYVPRVACPFRVALRRDARLLRASGRARPRRGGVMDTCVHLS